MNYVILKNAINYDSKKYKSISLEKFKKIDSDTFST